jgi:hypothetical protein
MKHRIKEDPTPSQKIIDAYQNSIGNDREDFNDELLNLECQDAIAVAL